MTTRDFVRGMANLVPSTLSGWRGTFVIKSKIGREQPATPLKLYDMEGCPYCRLAREALTELDLDVIIIPVPKGDEATRAELKARGGKVQMPYLVDANTQTELYESLDIVNYLFKEYGNGRVRSPLAQNIALASAMLASATRAGKGTHYSGSTKPKQLLELYSFESSPFSRPVREKLSEMGISYLLHNLGKNQLADVGTDDLRLTTEPYAPIPGSKREAMLEATGKVQVPYLIDSNTGTHMYESWDIIDYLEHTYGAK